MAEIEESMSDLSELDLTSSMIYILFLFMGKCIGDVCIIEWIWGEGQEGTRKVVPDGGGGEVMLKIN